MKIRKHMMTGISYMIPVIVAGGLCMALARILGVVMGLSPEQIVAIGSNEGTFLWMINRIGGLAMSIVVPVLSGFIAYSIADRPGIGPGLILGLVANEVNTGFLGGLVAAFLVGYFILFMKKYLKVPKVMKGLMPILIIPFISTLVVGMAMFLILGKPIAWIMDTFTNLLVNRQNGGVKFGLGAMIGGMLGFDLGGPMGKTASAFTNALLTEGIYGPSAAKIVSGMTPAIGIALAVLVGGKKRWSVAERETAKAALPLGLCFITEGVIPFAAADPVRVIVSTMIGSAIAGGLTQIWGVECMVPHGGIFVVPTMTNPMGFLGALIIGSFITFIIFYILKYRKSSEVEATIEDSSELDSLDLDF